MRDTCGAVVVDDVGDGLDPDDGHFAHGRHLRDGSAFHLLHARLVALHHLRVRRGAVQRVARGHHPNLQTASFHQLQARRALCHSHDGPIRRRRRGYILTMDPSDAGNVGMFSRWTNQTQATWVCSHDRPIRRMAARFGHVGLCTIPREYITDLTLLVIP
eukprot:839067-Prorocentrum_minimum.AAC.2